MSTTPTFADLTGPNDHRTHMIGDWERDGVVVLPKLIPDELIDEYVARWRADCTGERYPYGYQGPCSYERVPEMLRLATYRPLTEAMRSLMPLTALPNETAVPEEVGLHLTLTNFKSTERAWHQDRYLNPEAVGERYCAAWIALADVHADAGPFEYVPGSHKWPVIERNKVFEWIGRRGEKLDHKFWPSDTQGWVGDACDAEVQARGIEVKPFLAKRGDVLIWHASLMHRGSMPRDRSLERVSLIAHYSGVRARPDMPQPSRLANGSHVFLFGHS